MMKRRGIVWVLIVIFSVTVSVAIAGDKNDGSPGGKQSTGGSDTSQNDTAGEGDPDRLRTKENGCDNESIPDRDRDRDRDRVRDNTAEEPVLGYQTQDGVVHVWDDRFTPRMKQYEDQNNREAMNGYLNSITKRNYRFKNHEDTDGFVEWALRNRPWKDEN